MNSFDRVILSCDKNPKFLEFWPVVARAWSKLFGVRVHLAFVGDASEFPDKLRGYGSVYFFPAIDGIPIANQAKVARYFLASWMGDDSVVMINDVDLLPLSKDYVNTLLGNRPEGALVTLGSELYRDAENGKSMAGYLTAEARVFRALVNPKELRWQDWVSSFIGLKHFDHKEDISNPLSSENPDCFSDESLLRYFQWLNPVPVENRRMPFWPYTEQALDRADWKFDPQKLKDGVYKEAHLPRPYSENKHRIQPLLAYIESL